MYFSTTGKDISFISLHGETGARGMVTSPYLVKSPVGSYRNQARVVDRVPGDHTKGASSPF